MQALLSLSIALLSGLLLSRLAKLAKLPAVARGASPPGGEAVKNQSASSAKEKRNGHENRSFFVGVSEFRR